jgi:ligand-binding sensor domain-containing protein/serine phosphatase RsbU (regulator of sigma subunit)
MPRCLLLTYSLLSLFVASSALAQNSISIEGTLLMLDDKTPHVAVPVQAIRNGEVIATVLSDENGRYQFVNLKPGPYQLRCQILNGYVYYRAADHASRFTFHDSGTDDSGDILDVPRGKTLGNIDFRFASFKKGAWRNYSTLDGLGYNAVMSICCTPDGVMWFATEFGGISRYDGRGFTSFTMKDGLLDESVRAIHCGPDGVIWLGTWMGGVFLYDGKEFVNFTTEHGLAGNPVWAICGDSQGGIWFGTDSGASRYDGEEFANFTKKDGLVHNFVNAIHCDADGVMWFGTRGGVSRYDGKGFVSFTTEDGLPNNRINAICHDPDGVVWFGTHGGVSRYDGKEFINFTSENGLADERVQSILRDADGVMWFATRGGVSRYDGKTFVNFTTKDGLPCNWVNTIHSDPDGIMWFGTGKADFDQRGGVSRYDGEGFVNFTTRDGLGSNRVWCMHRDPDGVLWFGTRGSGIFRYDGVESVNLTTEDGLANNHVVSVYGDPDGILWFGTQGGVSRYDRKQFVNFTEEDGLANNSVTTIHRDPDSVMWFGTWDGVSRYDGKEFVNFTTENGLPNNIVWPIYRDPDGMMWLGTYGGLCCYDGRNFVKFATADGAPHHIVVAIHRDPDGVMWFGTWGGGVSRYDGKEFVNLTTEDGLANNHVPSGSIHCDPDGVMWFGTNGDGVSCYDGTVWASLDKRDGLAGNSVNSIIQDPEGFLWFGTEEGITRYRRSATPPSVHIVSVTTDQTYRLKTQDARFKTQDSRHETEGSNIPAFTVGTRVTVEYDSIDFKTIPEKRQYRCRIYETQDPRLKTQDEELRTQDSLESGVLDLGPSEAYNPPTRETSFDWTPREPGTYTFQVQAIDRDLNYSEPASLMLSVVSPFYLRAAFLIPTIGSGAIVLAIVVFLATALTKRRRQVHAYQQSAVEELQDAREMQMSLLPEAAPPVEGMEVAGRSTPANTVGGDFFDYLTLEDGKVGIAMADISGKGLRAAMNAVMTSGMLYEVVKTEMSCGSILSELNAGLCPRMERQTFAAFSFAIVSQNSERIQWSNGAQPRPLIKRGDSVSEVQGEGELPLGIMPDVAYPDHELGLQTGDIVVLYTDGVIEAENEAEEMYGAERLEECVTGINSAMGAEEIIEAILQDVSDFAGSAQQYDDMTIVVVKKL